MKHLNLTQEQVTKILQDIVQQKESVSLVMKVLLKKWCKKMS